MLPVIFWSIIFSSFISTDLYDLNFGPKLAKIVNFVLNGGPRSKKSNKSHIDRLKPWSWELWWYSDKFLSKKFFILDQRVPFSAQNWLKFCKLRHKWRLKVRELEPESLWPAWIVTLPISESFWLIFVKDFIFLGLHSPISVSIKLTNRKFCPKIWPRGP